MKPSQQNPHMFEFAGFGAELPGEVAAQPEAQPMALNIVELPFVQEAPLFAPKQQQAQQAAETDIFVLLGRRIRECRAEVKRLQKAEAELSLLEKMAAAAGITVEEAT